ncbi:MAG: SpoIIE family protein phosphatase [Acidobacteriaceae bacterium]|nr:SpoIIE family protein phosphatase [Acidobacteriaceae bacterium]
MIAIAFQVRSLEQIFPQWFGADFVQWPFLLDAEDRPYFVLQFVQANARAAGLRDDDILVAINALPVTSRSIYADVLSASRPGEFFDVTYRRTGEPLDRHARVPLEKLHTDNSLIRLLLYVVMPPFCLALGFWVVAVRLTDVRAWLLLGLMLSTATFFNSFPDFWGPPFRMLGSIYRISMESSWFAWLFLLGIYFPEPFPKTLRWSRWKWLEWIVLSLCALFVAAVTASFANELHSLTAAMPLNRFLVQTQLVRPAIELITVTGFLACIVLKYRIDSSADAKRRLRVLYAGAAVSLLPITGVFIVENLKRVTEEYFPHWLLMTVYLAFLLLPITLAYVVVVQRAMDVRVVIRQGLQYALARRGVLILQILLSACLFTAVAILMTSHTMSPLGTVAVLAGGFWGIFLLHGATQQLAIWVDRRFFRDAYHAEQILSDLAENVRSIVETKPLLETVARRISDSLHVKQIAVLLDGSGPYHPQHALGFSTFPNTTFPPNAATIELLKTEKQPTRVYFDDPDSWIYNTPAMSDEERSQLATLQSELLLPFSVKDELLGFISLGQKLSEAPYSGTDLRLLSSVAAQTGLALEVARLTTAMRNELAVRERLNRELEIARDVQQHLFPQHFPPVSGLDYAGVCRPAREVGGDYYDFLELPAGKLGVAIGDVSGKGIGASLMMASLGASLRGQAAVVENLAELIERVNRLVYGASSLNRYATFFYAEYDPRNRQLSYVNAGHNAPVILRRSNPGCQLFRLDAGGPPVGLLPQSSYEQGGFALEPGDLLVLFTDGISESMNSSDEEWGEERMIDLAKTCDAVSALETMNRIMTAAQSFAAGAPQHDDMTVVVLRVLG